MGVHFRVGGRYFPGKISCNVPRNSSIGAEPAIQVPRLAQQVRSFSLVNCDSGSPASGRSRGTRPTLRPKKDRAMSNEVQTVVQRCVVTEIVERRLRESMYISLRTVSCQFKDGLLTLRGIVPTFYLKQVILSLVEDLECEGIKRINDEIDVVNPRGLSSVR